MTFVKHARPARPFGTLIEDWFTEFPGLLRDSASAAVPVNIVENKDGYHLEVNAPGRNKENFKVQVNKGLLTISYEQPEATPAEDLKVIRKEFSAAAFQRNFTVDEKIDAANIQAKYENGLLKVFVPKKEEVKVEPQSIQVQ